MPATKPYRMLDRSVIDTIIPGEDAPLIAPNFKAMGASYDMLLALREEPYTMTQFVQDLANGNVSRSNVEMRRHFVMRNMSDRLGKSIEIDEFYAALHGELRHSHVPLSEFGHLDDEVRAALRLNLVMS